VHGTPAEVLDLLRAWNAADPEPAPLVIETSGSTGEPKPVVLSRPAMRASATATASRLGGPGQWLLNLPASYVAGLQVLFRSVLAGTDPVVQDGSFVEAAAAMTGERRFVSLVPTQLHRMLDDPAEVDALRTFSTVLVGGAAVPAGLRARAADAGVHVVATYGMSETTGTRWTGWPSRSARTGASGSRDRCCSTGTPAAPTSMRRSCTTAGSTPRTSAASTTTAGSRCSAASTTSSCPGA
jgi:O-succinylbenzoic acid--CoA ligase